MSNKFIFSYVDKNWDGIFRDLSLEAEKSEKLDFLYSHKRPDNTILKFIEKVLLSYKFNRIFKSDYFGLCANLENYNYKKNNVYHLILPSTSISKISIHYLNAFLKRHKNVKLYALLTDSMHADSPHMNFVRDKLFNSLWTKVLTYDKYDAKEFGFTWFGYTYYSNFDFVKASEQETDIYYSGFNKGNREDIILETYDFLNAHNIKTQFDIVSNTKNSKTMLKYLEKRISYPEVVSRVKSTNCILEVLQQNQKTQSLRYFEAIVYNKKLLTNNPNIWKLPFYDERYMKYFNDIKDIDFDWIREKEEINYHYKNQFSPCGLIKFLENNCIE